MKFVGKWFSANVRRQLLTLRMHPIQLCLCGKVEKILSSMHPITCGSSKRLRSHKRWEGRGFLEFAEIAGWKSTFGAAFANYGRKHNCLSPWIVARHSSQNEISQKDRSQKAILPRLRTGDRSGGLFRNGLSFLEMLFEKTLQRDGVVVFLVAGAINEGHTAPLR